MISTLIEILKEKKILILGFGKEGIATYKLLIQYLQPEDLYIADKDVNLNSKLGFEIHINCQVLCGENYLDALEKVDIIIKSPGISSKLLNDLRYNARLTSQTDLFLTSFRDQVIGVTGTKGKSTTASLISKMLSSHYKDVLLVGNIGVPPFEMIQKMSRDTLVVFELSSHQLENISCSPNIAVLLNIYEEHLDHYNSLVSYQKAKFKIALFQDKDDWLVANEDDSTIRKLIQNVQLRSKQLFFSETEINGQGVFLTKSGNVVFKDGLGVSEFDFTERKYLPGSYNVMNIMAAVCVAKILKVPNQLIESSVINFKGLPHRLEYIGCYQGIHFYNDSIATIPEATINAIKTLDDVDTLILGGVDRGIDYQSLIDFIPVSGVRNLVFMGKAGERIRKGMVESKRKDQNLFFIQHFEELNEIILAHTRKDHICLLSPAAASYDLFRNFEDRGDAFKKIAENL